jgi:hypothetical protein
MIRRPAFQRPMARLALLAILLLALVPTLGRIAQARAADADDAPSWAALCTMQGLQRVQLPATNDAPRQLPSAPQGSGDCAYCPLLAAVAVPTIVAVSVPAALPSPALCTSAPAVTRSGPHPCGLGSRGPPIAS